MVRSRASSFKWEYPLLFLRSSRSFLRLLPRLLATSISPFIFPSITCFRRQFYIEIKQSCYTPGQALSFTGGWGSQISRQSKHEGGKFVSHTNRTPLPQEIFLVLISARGWVKPRARMRPEGLCQWKNSNDNSGNRTRDLLVCRAVPQPTVLPRGPIQKLSSLNFVLVSGYHDSSKGECLNSKYGSGHDVFRNAIYRPVRIFSTRSVIFHLKQHL